MKKKFISLMLLTAMSIHGRCQKAETADTIGLRRYLSDVVKGNLGYIAGQLNVDRAEAALSAAKVFSNPELAVTYGNNQERTMQLGTNLDAGLSYPLYLGNVRGARIGVARAELGLARLSLESYFRNLRADAALAFYNSLKYRLLADVQEDTYRTMKQLSEADSLRLLNGTIMEVDARQSAVEARVQKNLTISAEAGWRQSLVELTRMMGSVRVDTSYLPHGTLEFPIREYRLDSLIALAKENRIELQMAGMNTDLSEKTVRLVKAGRAPEIGLETGISYNSVAVNEIAPSPAHYAFNLGVSVPLKFSSVNRGELQAAQLSVSQRRMEYLDAEQVVVAGVTHAFLEYRSQKKQLEEFHSGLLTEAGEILQKKIYSYQRGETGLLEVINAQRTYNEIRRSFYETHYDYLAALIELERAAGIWDM